MNATVKMSKRQKVQPDLSDFIPPSELSEASPKAKIIGVVTSLSPMKLTKGQTYFDGEITDGKTSLHSCLCTKSLGNMEMHVGCGKKKGQYVLRTHMDHWPVIAFQSVTGTYIHTDA